MADGFPNKPKILRGAFVEFGLTIPPLIVVFQFNPVQLSRSRSLSFSVPAGRQKEGYRYQSESISLRQFHGEQKDLLFIRDNQQVTVDEESINFEIRLDATDKMNDGDPIVTLFGIAPQLATLEMMVLPKDESLLTKALQKLSKKFSFTKSPNPPITLFIWGRHRVVPVNINSLNITETEFNTQLSPIRATVAVNVTVIEGSNPPYLFTRGARETLSSLHLANITEVVDVVLPIPGL